MQKLGTMISHSLKSLRPEPHGRFLRLSSPFLTSPRKVWPDARFGFRRTWRHFVCSESHRAAPIIESGVLTVGGRPALTRVPGNVVLTPVGAADGGPAAAAVFLGAAAREKGSRHVFRLGVLEGYRLLCLFRSKIWWMIPRVGNSGRDVPVETQMLLLEVGDNKSASGAIFYVLLLPVLDGPFRSSLQGNSANELHLCIESGDSTVEASQFFEAVYINYGRHPFDLMKESMKILQKKKGTFSLREQKKIPGSLDWFGWCTWDAFYTDVSPQGIKAGLKSLNEGSTPVRFLIIDDGWQETINDHREEGDLFVEGSQFAARLVHIKENSKFKRTTGIDLNETTDDLKAFITAIKKDFGLKYVYVWHALIGYWGGIQPNAPGTKKYNATLRYPVQSPGNIANVRDIAMDSMEKYGIGTIDPAKVFEFYNDLHNYLASQNIDGVKVDVQNVIETLGSGFGGRVLLTQLYQHALEKSISENFPENNIICCMGHNTDSIYSSKISAISRASEDYMPKEMSSQTLHITTVAFNSILLGEIVIPDWDMFYSLHHAAEFHAAARALGGCGIYVSDKPGQHDFHLLKRLVLPNGSVLRAKFPGRPTRDCLFTDPITDGKSLLKIWNLNLHSGLLGIFNCQGAGSWQFPMIEKNECCSEPTQLTGYVRPTDIEYLENLAGNDWTGDSAVYSFNSGALCRVSLNESFSVSLGALQCEVITVSPIRIYNDNIQFAPIGLLEMYNSGGAIEAVHFDSDIPNWKLNIKGRGSGLFGAFSNRRPKLCTLNTREEELIYNLDDKFLKLTIPTGVDSWVIELYFEH